MSAAFSQSATITFDAVHTTFTQALTLSAGDTLVVVTQTNGGTSTDVTSVSGCGATWTKLDNINQNVNQNLQYTFWVGIGASAGAQTLTIVIANIWNGNAIIGVFNGAPTQIAHPAPNQNSNVQTASVLTPSTTATAAGQVVVGAWCACRIAVTVTGHTDVPAAWTTILEINDPSTTTRQIGMSYRITTAAETATRTTTLSAVEAFTAFAVVLGSAPAVAPPLKPNVVAQSVPRSSLW